MNLRSKSLSPTEERLLLSYVGDGPKEVPADNDVSYAIGTGHDMTLVLQQPFRLATPRAHTFQDGQPRVSFQQSSIVRGTVYHEW